MSRLFLILACLLAPVTLRAQLGGQNSFDFLRLPKSPRLFSLGGTHYALQDRDPFLVFANPAALNPEMHQWMGITANFFLANTTFGTAAYAHHWDGVGTFFAGLHYVSYGEMDLTDAFGNVNGTFSANDLALVLGMGRSFGRYHVGGTAKILQSHIHNRNAWGLALDLGGLYNYEDIGLIVGATVKNAGAEIQPLVEGNSSEPVPVSVNLGASKTIPHTPFRLSLNVHNLQEPDLIFDNQGNAQQFDLSGDPIDNSPGTVDKIFRHTIWALEILFSENFHVRMAYNHQRRQELKAANETFSFTGLSAGLGFRISKFNLDYGFGRYFAGGTAHHLSISTSLEKFGVGGGTQKNPARAAPEQQ